LTYDPVDGTFYTTADKSEPHIYQFRLVGDSIEILRSGEVRGLDGNQDFEGIVLVENQRERLLYISTEKFWQDDSLACFAVMLDDFTYRPDLSFRIRPEGAGGNNNLEGIAYDPATERFYIGKERQPHGLYSWSRPDGQREIAVGAGFDSVYAEAVEKLSGKVSPERLESLKLMGFAGLTWDEAHSTLLILNRYGRCLIVVEITPERAPGFRIVALRLLDGIDFDAFWRDDISDRDRYGLAEGMTLFESERVTYLAIIQDPGPGHLPRPFVLPYVHEPR
jgi:uncharacterized protein YjiK